MRTKVGPGRAGFTEGLASEWAKFRTVRSTRWTLAAMAAFVLGIAAFVGATRSLQPDDTVLGGSLTGAPFGLLVGASFGVLVSSREYATGTIGATLMACPRRGVVLAAKATVTAAVMFGVALAACFLAYQVGTVMLPDAYAPGTPMLALLGVAACFSVTALGGLAVGALLRHSAGAITTMVAVLLLPSLIGPLLGDWERWVAGASPVAAVQKLSQSSDAAPDAVGSLGAWPSLLLVCGYVLVALVGAGLVFRRRDA
ncbi:MAG TPA: ABC transporter permease subunit [Actinomycetota bacterium]|nr:ABC transporter permease subunit [Actinomycetota bacterium]